jgi:hypothetical protein
MLMEVLPLGCRAHKGARRCTGEGRCHPPRAGGAAQPGGGPRSRQRHGGHRGGGGRARRCGDGDMSSGGVEGFEEPTAWGCLLLVTPTKLGNRHLHRTQNNDAVFSAGLCSDLIRASCSGSVCGMCCCWLAGISMAATAVCRSWRIHSCCETLVDVLTTSGTACDPLIAYLPEPQATHHRACQYWHHWVAPNTVMTMTKTCPSDHAVVVTWLYALRHSHRPGQLRWSGHIHAGDFPAAKA